MTFELDADEIRELQEMDFTTSRFVCVPWYEPEDYAEIREIMEDGKNLPADYDLWLEAADDAMERITQTGKRVIKATITPQFFLAWCRVRRILPNSAARVRFANELAHLEAEEAARH